tara:strand:- start:9387 stop:10328 length:942 start_codon:yes stop_codon:yes gene_type:complete
MTLKTTLFNPNASFLHLGVVWLPVILLILISIISSGIIIYNTPLAIDLSSDGFNEFVSVLRFPLGILTLIIPIVALLAANHRSEQTKEQIRVTGIQNNLQNYYKHLEEFAKYLEKERISSEIAGSRYIHKMIYPNAQFGNYEINEALIASWKSLRLLTLELLNKYPDVYDEGLGCGDLNHYASDILTLKSHLNERFDSNKKQYEIGLPLVRYGHEKPDYRGTYLSQSLNLIKDMIDSTSILDKLCQFSVEYESLLDEDLKNHFNYIDYSVVDDNDLENSLNGNFECTQSFQEANEKFKLFLKDISGVKKAIKT